MATQVQQVLIRSYKPYPCPTPDPNAVTLTVKVPLVPRLYLGRIQVVSQTPPNPTTGTVSPGSPSAPGNAQIMLYDYADFCAFLRADPAQWAVEITYDDQTNQVSDFEYYATQPIAIAGLPQVVMQVSQELEQLRTFTRSMHTMVKDVHERLLVTLPEKGAPPPNGGART